MKPTIMYHPKAPFPPSTLSTIAAFLLILMMASPSFSSPLHHHTKGVKAVYWFPGSISLSSVDSSLYTHMFCAFAGVNPSSFNLTISAANSPSFSSFTSTLRLRNPSIKTLLSIGGGDSNATTFSKMTASPASRRAFIASSISVARSYNFHGLDLDYEFPSSATDMSNLAVFLSDWRAAVKAESAANGKPCLLLTAAVYYSAVYHSVPLPAAAMAEHLDWINIMAYDFFAPAWSTLTRPASALFDPTSSISGSNGVNAWLKAGVPARKAVLGLPFYGRAYKLADAANHGYLAPFDGALPGTDNGAMTYRQIKEFIRNNTGVTTVYNETTAESYSYVGDTWITYDDVEAVAAKLAFVRRKGLLGYFAWQVGGDDQHSTLARTAGRFIH